MNIYKGVYIHYIYMLHNKHTIHTHIYIYYVCVCSLPMSLLPTSRKNKLELYYIIVGLDVCLAGDSTLDMSPFDKFQSLQTQRRPWQEGRNSPEKWPMGGGQTRCLRPRMVRGCPPKKKHSDCGGGRFSESSARLLLRINLRFGKLVYHTHTCIYIYVCVCVHVYLHIDIYIYIYMFIDIHQHV